MQITLSFAFLVLYPSKLLMFKTAFPLRDFTVVLQKGVEPVEKNESVVNVTHFLKRCFLAFEQSKIHQFSVSSVWH